MLHYVLRTNGGTLIVNGKSENDGDVVRHYNTATYIEVKSVASSSYHEFGTVNIVSFANGHFVVENNASVDNVIIEKSSDSSAKVSVDNKGNIGTIAGIEDGMQVSGIAEDIKIDYSTSLTDKGGYYSIDGYVKLNKDYEIENGKQIYVNEHDAIIDLNGHSITFTGNSAGYLKIRNVKVTINDSKGNCKIIGGKIIDKYKQTVWIDYKATLILNNGEIQCMEPKSIGVKLTGNNNKNQGPATFIMNGGYINKNVSTSTPVYGICPFDKSNVIINGGEVYGVSGGTAISGNGNGKYSTSITINGGYIKTYNDIAIYHPQKGTLTINGGYIEGTSGIYVKSGVLTINGGTIKGTGAATNYSYTNSGANATGDAVILDVCGYPGGDPSAFVISNESNIVSEHANALVAYIGVDDEASKIITLLNGANVSYKLFRKDNTNETITEINK